jgi:hypothetical protein
MLPRVGHNRGAPGAAVSNVASALVLVVMGLAALAVASPVLTRLTAALVPFVLVVGIVVAVLRLTWSYTRKW